MTSLLDISSTEYQLISHPRTETALEEAKSLGLPADEIAKTIVLHVAVRGDLTIGASWARAVLPASERLDLHKVRAFFGESRDVRLATEPELAEFYPEFELGPFRRSAGGTATSSSSTCASPRRSRWSSKEAPTTSRYA